MAEDKVYADGVYIREKTFESTGNTILNVGIDAAKMIAFLNKHKDERGFVNVGISRRKTESDKGITHTCWLDTWKPKQQGGQPVGRTAAPGQRRDDQPAGQDDIPF